MTIILLPFASALQRSHACAIWHRTIVPGIFALALTACGGPPSEPQPVVIEAPAEPEEPIVVTQGIEPETVIKAEQIDNESPWDLALKANLADAETAVILRLQAIELFLDQQEYTAAETQANFLIDAPLTAEQRFKIILQRGRIANGRGDHQLAIEFLQPLRTTPLLSEPEREQALLNLAGAQLGLARKIDAIVSLMQRDRLLDPDTQFQNQQNLLQLYKSLNDFEVPLLQQTARINGFPPNIVDGWLAFSQLEDAAGNTNVNVAVWQTTFPGHPARPELIGAENRIALDQFDQVALLLPLTSPFGNAAQAFYDGFLDAYSQDTNPYRPSISLHDIGEDGSLARFYYQSAVLEGADFIVGPLGRNAVTLLLEEPELALPTLVLGDIEPAFTKPELYGISLSPEQEAIQVAKRAYNDGHRQAGILQSDDAWGNRAGTAFTAAWQKLGGVIVTNRKFPPKMTDFSQVIQQSLEISQSVVREQVLAAQLGLDIKFTPRRRQDTDCLFLAADAKQSRLLVPQLRFFQAHNLPMYATSKIFTGRINPAVDADLDGLVFGDMNWMVDIRYGLPEVRTDITRTAVADSTLEQSADQVEDAQTDSVISEKQLPPQPVSKGRYSFSPLGRLYALGFESYHLVPRLSVLQGDSWQRYRGQAFEASVDQYGNVIRHLEWVTFDQGKLQLIDQQSAATN